MNFASDVSTARPQRMPAESPKAGWSAMLRLRQLALLVHADAFRSDPASYCKALWWRLRGLRVRSKNKLAELMGRSPRAYDLWVAKVEPQLLAHYSPALRSAASSIITIVDCGAGSQCLSKTLTSLGDDPGRVIIVNDNATDENFERIRHLRELAPLIRDERWLCLLQAGDALAPGALPIYAKTAESTNGWIIYSDDDLIGSDGRRRDPHFKPGWNPELFDHHDFLTGSSVVRVSRQDLETIQLGDGASQLVRNAITRDPAPVHLPIVLHHRRQRPCPNPPGKAAGIHALPKSSVGVVVPTRNQLSLLRKCVEGIKSTDYPSLEVVIVDNGSDDPDTLEYLHQLEGEGLKVLRSPGPFNYSALNNAAVQCLHTDYLCFLNNDVEMMDADWLKLLVGHASREDIGAVGARLLYPDGTVQHAGVFTGIGGGAGHAHRFLRDGEAGYFQRSRLPQRVSAVTGACLVVAREKFLAVGGFDEIDFPVAFNDVDLCLKLNARGWQSFYEPLARLIHHESKSRGSDRDGAKRERFARELAALKRKWRTDEMRDPYHNPNLSPFCEQFLIAV